MHCAKKNTILILSIAGTICLSFFFGFHIGSAENGFVQESQSSIEVRGQVVNTKEKAQTEDIDFNQFWKIWKTVRANYVDQPVDETPLYHGAIKGMVAGLNDEHSVYLPPVKAKVFSEGLSGEFGGIGAEIGIRDEQLVVIAPLPETPAEKSGLASGDKILAVDGTETRGLTVEEAVKIIKGKPGTMVVLTVSRNGLDAVEQVSIVREVITIPTVLWEQKENNIAYLRISYFNEDTLNQFNTKVKELLHESPKGIILDLRSNPGGFLQTAVLVASEWVEEGVVVREVFQSKENTKEYVATGANRLAQIPTVILVDKGTASGSEIVAGALQDYKKAVIIGTKTFGKGSVQSYEEFPDGSALKLTVAKWFTPENRGIDKEGIEPDIVLEEMFQKGEEFENGFKDLGIERALEELQSNRITQHGE
ncbi:MAG: peptidase S41 [Candidatus Magasanikbacteria bacterium]|nr:peptidase S41 [Candidatus Magasanikbacteria bacterium]|tara:strand:+ start:1256 stop:2521 length:1266 start_codon:yes stop_codon:yes gene_type:complete